MTNLLILADGGGEIGLGHIMRCLAIKKSWDSGIVKLLVHMEDECTPPEGCENFKWLNEIAELEQYATENTLLLVDSYRPNKNHFHQLKNIFPFVAVLDDYNRIIYPVDLIICPGVYGKEMKYRNQSALTVGGPEYVILRPEILCIKKTKKINDIPTILLTLGGSQENSVMFQEIIDLLENISDQLIVITGNVKIAQTLSSRTAQIYGKLNASQMAEIMSSADIAICAAGQTLNELAWLGIPAFMIKTGEDQNKNWLYYQQNNLSLGAISAHQKNYHQVLLSALTNDLMKSRLNITNKLKKLLTANGANLICSLIKHNGNKTNE